MRGISVVICCYNSACRINLALKYLLKQKTADTLEWEIVLVDNNSSDNTVEIANQTWQSFKNNIALRVITEPKAGLSNAREAGVKAANYDVIIFCDDDNLVAENYLQRAFNLVQITGKLGYGIWGGKTIAFFDDNINVPAWFDAQKSNYVVGEQARYSGDISKRGYVWGAGMIIVKSLYLKLINDKLPVLLKDRTGEVLSSGGDSELSLRSLIAGYKLYYDADLILHHYIPAIRLTKTYNERLTHGFAAASTVLNKYKIFIYYVSERNLFSRLYYSGVYISKYLFSKLHIKKLTAHDNTVLHALFRNKTFYDADFNLMRGIFETRNK